MPPKAVDQEGPGMCTHQGPWSCLDEWGAQDKGSPQTTPTPVPAMVCISPCHWIPDKKWANPVRQGDFFLPCEQKGIAEQWLYYALPSRELTRLLIYQCKRILTVCSKRVETLQHYLAFLTCSLQNCSSCCLTHRHMHVFCAVYAFN